MLLVDDRRSNLMALTALLDPLRCDVTAVETGEEALQLLLVQQYSVILLDVQLPGLDGFEVAELIKQRERTRDIPIIFLTATTEEQSALRGYSVGAVDFVSKPFNPTLLQSKVQAFIALSQAHEQMRRQAADLAAMLAERDETALLLAAQAHELRRSNDDLENLAAIASHDLAEPLRVIAGYSELLGERCAKWDDDEAGEITAAIERGVARMQRLIDGILAYARAGTAAPTEEVPLAEVVAESLLALEVLIQERQAQVHVDDLPSVVYNRTQLGQLLQNLLSNAVKFVPPGRVPTVHVTAHREGTHWKVAVADNGIGVSEEERDRMFDMFGRRGGPRPSAAAGMGLAVCGRIVEHSGGTLNVVPNADGGSVFTFTIPDRITQHSAQWAREGSA